jgi:hypothetical protein
MRFVVLAALGAVKPFVGYFMRQRCHDFSRGLAFRKVSEVEINRARRRRNRLQRRRDK